MNRKAIFFGAFVLVLVSGASVSAQGVTTERSVTKTSLPAARPGDAPRTSAQRESSQVSTDSADIAITATVTAKELMFEVVPNPTVEFPGKHKRDTVWEAERENLPPAVEPGVTYRNIGIRLKIVSRFADIERIVAEALGEVPVTDKVQPPEKALPQPNAPPPVAPTPQPDGGSPQ